MDYRKAWEAVKLKVEQSVEEGEDRRFNEDSDTRESGMYEAYKKILDHMIELESAETLETPEAPEAPELSIREKRVALAEKCDDLEDCDSCPLRDCGYSCNFATPLGAMIDDQILEAYEIMFCKIPPVEVGTLILVKRTGSGAIGAEHKVAIVTDEPNTHGLPFDRPGYNVAVLKTGQIWRIPHTSEVDILYRPHK